VRVIGGPLYGLEGYVRSDEGGTQIVLNVEILGQAVAVSIAPGDCEKLTP
jgi:transcription antitermination factor NusG